MVCEPETVDRSMFCCSANDKLTMQAIKTLKNGIGLDGIRAQDLKLISTKITPVLTKLINISLDTGIIPSELKTAIYRPVHKGGAYADYQNYRPIALLNSIFKVLERFVAQQLTNYLSRNNLISVNQYAYQKKKGTNSLLMEFSQSVQRSLNNRQQILVLFVDFSKAFDVLDFAVLIEKLKLIGINGKLLRWFTNYLDREFVIRLWNKNSVPRLASGVFQGSILGPLLFLIYINSLKNLFDNNHTRVYCYADDVAVVVNHTSIETAVRIMQKNFNELDGRMI